MTVSWEPLVPSYELTVTDCADAPEQIAFVNGYPHRPLGNASATLGQTSLTAENIGRREEDGLEVELEDASAWTGLLLPQATAVGENAFEAAIYAPRLPGAYRGNPVQRIHE